MHKKPSFGESGIFESSGWTRLDDMRRCERGRVAFPGWLCCHYLETSVQLRYDAVGKIDLVYDDIRYVKKSIFLKLSCGSFFFFFFFLLFFLFFSLLCLRLLFFSLAS